MLYHMRQKNCTVLFLQQLCQNFIYYDNFWHTYTSINFLSPTYSIILYFIRDGEPAYVLKVQWVRCGTAGWNKLLKSCKKLARRQDKAAALKAYRISLVFLFCNIHTQTGYYKRGICH